MMTDKILEGMATQGLNMARTELRYRHQLNGILAIYIAGEGLHRLRAIERYLEQLAGPAWLQSGHVKDCIFGAIASGNKHISDPPDAVLIVTGGDEFVPTDAMLALPEEDQKRIFEGATHPKRLPHYFKPRDVVISLAQSPERICLLRQHVQMPGALLIGQPSIVTGPQENFNGRLKVYGVDPLADLEAAAHGE